MDIRQMMAQTVMGRMANNPVTKLVLQMKQQGMSPEQAIQQLGQQYPQFRQLQGVNPNQIDKMVISAMQQTGIDPNSFLSQFQKMF